MEVVSLCVQSVSLNWGSLASYRSTSTGIIFGFSPSVQKATESRSQFLLSIIHAFRQGFSS